MKKEGEDTQANDDIFQKMLIDVTSGTGDEGFLVPSADKQGHGELMQFRVPPTLPRQIEEMVNLKIFPYKTKSDVCRHAIVRHLIYLHQREQLPEKSKTLLCQGLIVDEILRDQMLERKFEETVNTLAAEASRYQGSEDETGARQLVARIWSLFNAAEDSPRKRAVLEKMKRQLGHLLPSGPISMMDLGEEPDESR